MTNPEISAKVRQDRPVVARDRSRSGVLALPNDGKRPEDQIEKILGAIIPHASEYLDSIDWDKAVDILLKE
jgi:hypothetical protein